MSEDARNLIRRLLVTQPDKRLSAPQVPELAAEILTKKHTQKNNPPKKTSLKVGFIWSFRISKEIIPFYTKNICVLTVVYFSECTAYTENYN